MEGKISLLVEENDKEKLLLRAEITKINSNLKSVQDENSKLRLGLVIKNDEVCEDLLSIRILGLFIILQNPNIFTEKTEKQIIISR